MRPTSDLIKRKRHLDYQLVMQFMLAASLLLVLSHTVTAIPVNEYREHVRQAVTALDTLAHSKATESTADYERREVEALRNVRNLLPQTETVESRGGSFNIDNSWLHEELDKYAADSSRERYDSLRRTTQRLKSTEERIAELEKSTPLANGTKDERSRKLAEILRRPEYAREIKKPSAIPGLLERFIKWILSWLPQPKPRSVGGLGWITRIAQWLVIALALGVLVYVAKLFLPRMLRARRPKKKSKAKARIVLGERLEPDESALDLLAEAEGLARRGELRAAIRKAYIALLVELGDRKIISLAQYKTNRDYLRAVREVGPLYGDVKQLTDSFERHWYGLAQATETDWLAFRSAYKQALSR